MSPTAVLDVMLMAPEVLRPALIATVSPAIKVIDPDVELTAALTVKLLPAPVAVIVTVPVPPAVTADPTVTDPALAIREIFPPVVVVTPVLTVKLPLAAVKLNGTEVTAAFTSVDVAELVIV